MDLNIAGISKRPAPGADNNHVRSAIKGEVVMDKKDETGERLPPILEGLFLAEDKIEKIINAAYNHEHIQLLEQKSKKEQEEERERFRQFLEKLKAPYYADVKFMHPDRLRLLVAAFKNMVLEDIPADDEYAQQNEVHYKAPHGEIVVTPQEITWRPRPLITKSGQKVLRHAFNEKDAAALALAAMFDETLAPPNQMIIHGNPKQQRMIMHFINRFNALMPDDEKRIVAPEVKKVLFFNTSTKPNGFGQWRFDQSQKTLGLFGGPLDHEYKRLFAHERTLTSRRVPPKDVPVSAIADMDRASRNPLIEDDMEAQPINHFVPNMDNIHAANFNGKERYSFGEAMNELERIVTGESPKLVDPTEPLAQPEDSHDWPMSDGHISMVYDPSDPMFTEMAMIVNLEYREKEAERQAQQEAIEERIKQSDENSARSQAEPVALDVLAVSEDNDAEAPVNLTNEYYLRSLVDEWVLSIEEVADLVIQRTAEDIIIQQEQDGLEELQAAEAEVFTLAESQPSVEVETETVETESNSVIGASIETDPAAEFEAASSPPKQAPDNTPASEDAPAKAIPPSEGFTPYDVYQLVRNYVCTNREAFINQPVSKLNEILSALPKMNDKRFDVPATAFANMLEHYNMVELDSDDRGEQVFKGIATFKPRTDLYNTIANNILSASSIWMGKDVKDMEKIIQDLCGHDFGGYADAAAEKIIKALMEDGFVKFDADGKIKAIAEHLLGVPVIEKAFAEADYLELVASDKIAFEAEKDVKRDNDSIHGSVQRALVRVLDLNAA